MWKLLITWFSGGWTLGQSCTNPGTQRPLLWSASSFMFHILLLSPVAHSWQFASLSDCSIWGPPCRAWCRRSALRWRPAARRTRRGWGCRTRWGPPGDLNSAVSSAILRKVKGKGFWPMPIGQKMSFTVSGMTIIAQYACWYFTYPWSSSHRPTGPWSWWSSPRPAPARRSSAPPPAAPPSLQWSGAIILQLNSAITSRRAEVTEYLIHNIKRSI